jgi:predicted O-linked N-acetylglucosamine transferase (SPINDLY family)
MPMDRVTVAGKAGSREEYLSRFGDIDVALDTTPFNGITTTCDGLWMGVPHVCLRGATGVARCGASILHGCGLGECVAEDPTGYVQLACALAADADRLRSLRATMRERLHASPLLDQTRYTHDLEAAFLSAVRQGSV